MGDPTPKNEGRLSLNPLRHLEWVGSFIVPLLLILTNSPFLFGWARPVPINIAYYRHPQRDLALVAFAGPLSNLILALLLSVLISLFPPEGIFSLVVALLVYVNIILALFNLIPLPPLDGSKIIQAILPARLASAFLSGGKWGFAVVIGLFWFFPSVLDGLASWARGVTIFLLGG